MDDKISAERERIREEIRQSLRMTGLERLQWLEEIVALAEMAKAAPTVQVSEPAAGKYKSSKG